MRGSAAIMSSRSSCVVRTTSVSPSSQRRANSLPRTLSAGVPYEVLSSASGNASPSPHAVCHVILRYTFAIIVYFRDEIKALKDKIIPDPGSDRKSGDVEDIQHRR